MLKIQLCFTGINVFFVCLFLPILTNYCFFFLLYFDQINTALMSMRDSFLKNKVNYVLGL